MPMERAVPSTCLIAPSRSIALRSFIFNSAISFTCWRVTLPTFSLFGTPGISIVGTASGTLPFTVNWDLLITELRENLNTYWRSWTRHPKRLVVLYSDWGIQWAVLGVLRQFFTFREKSITTKVKAGEYALDCLPRRWHPLIQEAINIRQGQKGSLYRFRFGRMVQTVRFLNYVIDRCNGQFVS